MVVPVVGCWEAVRNSVPLITMAEQGGGQAMTLHATGRAAEAARRLKHCAIACENYAELVFGALHGTREEP